MNKSVVFLAVLGLVACSKEPKSGEVSFTATVDTLEVDALRCYTVNYEVWGSPSDTAGVNLAVRGILTAGAVTDSNKAVDYLPAGDTLRGSFYYLSVPVTAGPAELDLNVTKIDQP
ncbi:MAG: hypothetical protein ACO30N_04125 [Schleiferiaceae bacterium]